MADIELIIKIPEEMYQKTIAGIYEGEENDCLIIDTYIHAIEKGTPLPKGHGDLIDTSELLTVTDIREDGSEVTYVLYTDIENATKIIKADKTESEDKE